MTQTGNAITEEGLQFNSIQFIKINTDSFIKFIDNISMAKFCGLAYMGISLQLMPFYKAAWSQLIPLSKDENHY